MKSLKEMENEVVLNMRKLIKEQPQENYQEVSFTGFHEQTFTFITRDEDTGEQAVFYLHPYNFAISVRCEYTKEIELLIGFMDERGELI